jgi:hypothetical protein
MQRSAIRNSLPYVVGLVVAAVLFYFARGIEYTPRPGMLGPDFWPKAAIGLMTVVCLFEIVRSFAGLRTAPQGVAEELEKEADEEKAPAYPRLLIGGIVLVTVYAVVVESIGFLLSTFLFLVAFMYLGRYWNHAAVWAVSTGVTLLAALVFIRFAYVSLPRGEPPFDAITDFVRVALGG